MPGALFFYIMKMPEDGPSSSRVRIHHPVLATVGVVCVILGAIGILVPGMPGTLFLLIASWCFAKSFPSLERRLLRNRFFAPYMRFVDGDAPLPAKDRFWSITLMWASTVFSTWFLWWRQWVPDWFLPLVPLAACVGTIFILRRGSAKKTSSRIVIYGNSGSGKTTMANQLAAELRLPVLSLDAITWTQTAERKPLDESQNELLAFIAKHPGWIIEGCYGDLIEAALPHCDELRFLNPGVERCIAHCRARPWEQDKYPTREEQDQMLSRLIDWVREYDTREDEFGLKRHRAIFDGFAGMKREFASPANFPHNGSFPS